jgi:hypothetical protein
LISLDKVLIAPLELAWVIGREQDSKLAIHYVILLIFAKPLIHRCTKMAIQNTKSLSRCCE